MAHVEDLGFRIPLEGTEDARQKLSAIYADPAFYVDVFAPIPPDSGVGMVLIDPAAHAIEVRPPEVNVYDVHTAQSWHKVEEAELAGHFNEKVGFSVQPGYRQFDQAVATTRELWSHQSGGATPLQVVSYDLVAFTHPVWLGDEVSASVTDAEVDETGIVANVNGMVDDHEVFKIKGLRLTTSTRPDGFTPGQVLESAAQVFGLVATNGQSLEHITPAFRDARTVSLVRSVEEGEELYVAATIGRRAPVRGVESIVGSVRLYTHAPNTDTLSELGQIGRIAAVLSPR